MKRAAIVLVVGLLGLGGWSVVASSAKGASPNRVARSYVEAYNARDGKTICKLLTSDARTWIDDHTGLRSGISCARLVTARIGYGEEGDTPTFVRLEVISSAAHREGMFVRVEVKARYRYAKHDRTGGTASEAFTDEIYLVQQSGLWRVAKPGGVYYLTQSAYSPPASALDPPITDTEAHRPAPQPSATFSCAAVRRQRDGLGDAPASLDLRQVSVGLNADGSVCFTVSFVSRPRPGTEVNLRIERPVRTGRAGEFLLYEKSLRIGHGGRLFFRGLNEPPSRDIFQGGWKACALDIRWRPARLPVDVPSLTVGVATRTLQNWEPMIRHPLLGRAPDPQEGSGDSAELTPR